MTHRNLFRILFLGALFAVAAPLAAQEPQASSSPKRQIPDYRIGPTDHLAVNVFSGTPQPEFSARSYVVQTDNTITLPYLQKPVVVGGLLVAAAREAVRKALVDNKVYADPVVDIQVTLYKSSSLTVQGAVKSPGRLTLEADRMFLPDVISAAGNFQTNAGSRIWVIPGQNRPKPGPDVQIDKENGYEVYQRQDVIDGKLTDVALYEEDTVRVETAPKFYVNGEVKGASNPDYFWVPGLTVSRALAMAGGATPAGALNRLSVQRLDPKTGAYKEVKIKGDKMLFQVQPEDIIIVPKRRM